MVLNAVVNKPYHIIERQKMVQRSHKPIYYRLPRSNIYMASYYSLFTVGMCGVVYGAYSLIKGKKTE
ncbi:hypothetical protein GLOTRDRAFT_125270 [Gloeophyllum trabeum ATCC 11539]|uniref:Uncharacterized protein n=1 Tax=Gloeophyllum trabeum (strain ATCC 11539 / FP-39264 / Madison 617) TaxID=670483 RepID=S7QGC8_GLOTA|nr:uncharacterized protein GLOTRDRAFT_125270 [Gloeophyllum trabeum ATCC 11539]EPQ58951.1 hypothetical protein GLOTRDRAFT_125270 [Gloeophyllum trabeum ATCC 11539]